MGFYLGLDVGSTTLSVVVLDAATGKALLRHTADMACQATSPHDRRRGRSELDLDRLMSLVLGSLAQAAEALGDRAREIHGMGITGQQHGLALKAKQVLPQVRMPAAVIIQEPRSLGQNLD